MKQQSYETEHEVEVAYTGNLSMILLAKTTSQKRTKRTLINRRCVMKIYYQLEVKDLDASFMSIH
jgi:hypothetical protein